MPVFISELFKGGPPKLHRSPKMLSYLNNYSLDRKFHSQNLLPPNIAVLE